MTASPVWRLDRLGRSLKHLIDVVFCLESRGVAFRSLTESIDTSTPGGQLTLHLYRQVAGRKKAVPASVRHGGRQGRSGRSTRHP